MTLLMLSEHLGNALACAIDGKLPRAETAALLTARPGKASVLELLGLLALAGGDARRAVMLLRKAAPPESVDAAWRNNLGVALAAAGEATEAISYFREAGRLAPDAPEPLINLARLLRLIGNPQGVVALTSDFEQALMHRPNHPEGLCALAELAGDGAVDDLEMRLRDARANAVNASEQCRIETALGSLARLRRDTESEARHYHRALYYCPADVKARVALAKLLLLNGDYARGWHAFEWRWRQASAILPPRRITQPLWCGQPLDGAPILLHAEQGYGDVIQFARYAPLVAAAGGKVILEVPRTLKKLMTSLDGVETVIATGEPVPRIRWQCPLMSLPFVFGTTLDTVPSRIPYLRAQLAESRAWSAALPREGLRVGILWAGSGIHPNDRRRSMPPAALAPLKRIAGGTFISLQQHAGPAPASQCLPFDCIDYGGALTDFSVTAAIIGALDLVIAVDTSTAHLAGALGKQVWILLPFAGEYRWLLDREDSPWYPTARLFRQPSPGDWASVIESVVQELRRLIT